MSDGQLVRQALAGRSEAYEELVRRWAGRIVALCHAKTGRADAAEDLAQETLLRGYRALGSLVDPDKFGPWLCGIAVRACLDWWKTRDKLPVVFSALGDHFSPQTSRNPDREEELRQLMAEVEALPEEYRTVVMLYYYEDVTYRELAQLLGVSPGTINARLTKARALLRERLTGCPR